MKKYLPALCLLMAVVTISLSCGPSLKVTSDYDKTANFSQYKTFSLYKDDKSIEAVSQLNQGRILNAVRNEMIKKGYQETTSSPNLLVNTVAVVKDKVSVSANTNYYGYGGMYRPYYWGAGSVSSNTTYDVQNYKDGSLIIDIVDANSKQILWQGTGNKEIDKPLKDPDAEIPKIISSIMASFPPGAAKK